MAYVPIPILKLKKVPGLTLFMILNYGTLNLSFCWSQKPRASEVTQGAERESRGAESGKRRIEK